MHRHLPRLSLRDAHSSNDVDSLHPGSTRSLVHAVCSPSSGLQRRRGHGILINERAHSAAIKWMESVLRGDTATAAAAEARTSGVISLLRQTLQGPLKCPWLIRGALLQSPACNSLSVVIWSRRYEYVRVRYRFDCCHRTPNIGLLDLQGGPEK